MKSKLLSKFYSLETVEQKSFWTISPLVVIVGLVSLSTATSYGSVLPTYICVTMCLFFPLALMVFVYFNKNYHLAYPILCISTGAISIPITFIFSGGFLSGMPLFCVVSTFISGLCFSKKWRYISFICCLLGNSAAFYYVYVYGTPFPLATTAAIYNDVIFGYVLASLAGFLVIDFATTEMKKYHSNQDALQGYFDKDVRDQILKNQGTVSSFERKAVILFIDISNFTTITEKMSNDMTAKFLNEFFYISGQHIHQSNGTIDKYIGDCVMAYWLEQENENCVYNAIKTVLDIQNELIDKAEMIFEKYGTELNFSAGLSYGNVIFGDIGIEGMHNYTVIGDAVNTASRIENYSVAGEILISDGAAKHVKDLFSLELVENGLYFKGKNTPINVYRVLGENRNKEIQIDSSVDNGYLLYVCGCRGSFPVSGLRFGEYGGETSCYVIRKNDYAVIVDCGTGLKNAYDLVADCKKIDVLLTHVHYDHILGLLMSKLPDHAKIRFYGNFDDWKDTRNTLVNFMQPPFWPVKITNTETISITPGQSYELLENMRVCFFLSDHPDAACVIQLFCEEKKICFFADCEDATKLDPAISMNSDLLFFDGMYDDNDMIDHTGWGHGTWQKGVEFFTNQHIHRLIITHHDPEVSDHLLHLRENQAKEVSTNISFAKTGDRYLI